LLDAEPPTIDARESWQTVAEASFKPGEPAVSVGVLMSDAPATFVDMELPADTDWFRVRAHAAGRSINFDGVASQPDEHHLLQIWPASEYSDPIDLREDDPWERQGT
jgi:hypothetical protein